MLGAEGGGGERECNTVADGDIRHRTTADGSVATDNTTDDSTTVARERGA